jgi:chemotaxis protein methyltransferase WspC
MLHAKLEDLLRHTMGLDAASIGSSAVERAVMRRMSACELEHVGAYWERLRTSSSELQALIETVIVPETWFFRDPEAFVELARVASDVWLSGDRGANLCLLSVPCSSGEEPYSMAMALCDAGLSKRFRIDAIDISARAIAHARCAVYGKNSFRGTDLQFRDRHFATTPLGSRLCDAAREGVQFQHGNLLAEDFLPGSEIYDFIFCRNLLIYFDRSAQDRALQVLERLLKPKGVLFVGPSESGLLLNHGFVSSTVPMAFSFRRSGGVNVAILPSPAPAMRTPPTRKLPSVAHEPIAATHDPTAAATHKPTAATHEHAYAEALRLADEGHLAEAAKACEEHLGNYGPSVSPLFLLGLIRAAAGNLGEAREYYRRALYLDRNHHDTLLHLRLLLEKQGDAMGAQVIHERLQRLLSKRTA